MPAFCLQTHKGHYLRSITATSVPCKGQLPPKKLALGSTWVRSMTESLTPRESSLTLILWLLLLTLQMTSYFPLKIYLGMHMTPFLALHLWQLYDVCDTLEHLPPTKRHVVVLDLCTKDSLLMFVTEAEERMAETKPIALLLAPVPHLLLCLTNRRHLSLVPDAPLNNNYGHWPLVSPPAPASALRLTSSTHVTCHLPFVPSPAYR